MELSQQGGPPMPLTIVFVERKNRCNEVAYALQQEGIPAAALHGGLSQVSAVASWPGEFEVLRIWLCVVQDCVPHGALSSAAQTGPDGCYVASCCTAHSSQA